MPFETRATASVVLSGAPSRKRSDLARQGLSEPKAQEGHADRSHGEAHDLFFKNAGVGISEIARGSISSRRVDGVTRVRLGGAKIIAGCPMAQGIRGIGTGRAARTVQSLPVRQRVTNRRSRARA